MKPWVCIDSATVPGGGELHLWEHVSGFSIRSGTDELMNSRAHGSEDAMSDLACKQQGPRSDQRILIGGLGMGFTAAAALRTLADDGCIIVAELVPAVVEWNRGPLSVLNGQALEDPRLTVEVTDVAHIIKRANQGPSLSTPSAPSNAEPARPCPKEGDGSASFDQILLDVDNGPQGMCAESNNWLYRKEGLSCAYRALRPGGILAVWSAVPDEAFTRRMKKAGFSVEVVRLRAHKKRGAHHHVWFGTVENR